jgi:hypothetical protein
MRLLGRPDRRPAAAPVAELEAPVAGVRTWIAAEEPDGTVALRSLLLPHRSWASATETAACSARRPPHTAPHQRCECGLYAWWRLDETAVGQAADAAATALGLGSLGAVLGAVVGWGDRVVLHREGWRAGRARIVALAQPDEQLCAGMLQRYLARVEPSAEWAAQRTARALWASGAVLGCLAAVYGVPLVPQRGLEIVAAEHGCRPEPG